MNCYMQGLKHRSTRSKMLMARVLWLLPYDGPEKSLASTLGQYGESLPTWLWLLWVPQLLQCLDKPEGAQVWTILLKLAMGHPQAIYYHVRTYVAERKEAQRRAGLSGEEEGNTAMDIDEEAHAERLALKGSPQLQLEAGLNSN